MILRTLTDKETADLNNRFSYHAPKGDQAERYGALREKTKELATLIVQLTPSSREQATALTQLTLVSMLANAAIAINEV